MNKSVILCANTAWNLVNFREGLIKALLAKGYEVVAMSPRDEHVHRLEQLGCRFVEVEMDNRGTSPARDALLFTKLFNAIRAEKPIAFLGFTIKPNVYGSLAARVLNVPVINTIEGMGSAFIEQSWLNKVASTLYRLALQSTKRVFVLNKENAELLIEQKFVGPQKIELIPGIGIDLVKFQPSPLQASDGNVRFILIARLLWEKGVGEFVEAARLVRKTVPHAQFQVLGFLDVPNPSAIDKATMDRWVSEDGIQYLGVSSDVRPFIAEADCVVLPSYYNEGVPRSLLEGAAMGKPLITTDWVGCRDVVDDGVNGYLCQPRDANDLAEKMLRFIALEKVQQEAMGSASRRKAETHFDENIIIARYVHQIKAV